MDRRIKVLIVIFIIVFGNIAALTFEDENTFQDSKINNKIRSEQNEMRTSENSLSTNNVQLGMMTQLQLEKIEEDKYDQLRANELAEFLF